MSTGRNPADLLPGEGTIEQEASEIFEDPERWLSTEHALLGGKRPRDCIGAPDEQAVRDLLRTIRQVGTGVFCLLWISTASAPAST
jgi:hypothetical protein